MSSSSRQLPREKRTLSALWGRQSVSRPSSSSCRPLRVGLGGVKLPRSERRDDFLLGLPGGSEKMELLLTWVCRRCFLPRFDGPSGIFTGCHTVFYLIVSYCLQIAKLMMWLYSQFIQVGFPLDNQLMSNLGSLNFSLLITVLQSGQVSQLTPTNICRLVKPLVVQCLFTLLFHLFVVFAILCYLL